LGDIFKRHHRLSAAKLTGKEESAGEKSHSTLDFDQLPIF
jgi:hypothetical protein